MNREQRIKEQIQTSLQIEFLDIVNESRMHNVPVGAETHFKVTVVSEQFAELKTIQRHRLLNQILAEELSSGLHALSLHLFTKEEWETRKKTTEASPGCRGGGRKG